MTQRANATKYILQFLVYMAGIFVVVLVVNLSIDRKWGSFFDAFDAQPVATGIEVPRGISAEILKELTHGGYTIFIRHSRQTDHDASAFDRYETLLGGKGHPTFTEGRCLNEYGEAEAWLLSKLFELGEIPVGTVYSSPVCRAKQTAEIAFGRIDVIDQTLNYLVGGSNASSAEEKALADENFWQLISAPLEKGTNRVLVSHSGMFTRGEGLGWQEFSLEKSGILVIRHESEEEITPIAVATLKELALAFPLPANYAYSIDHAK